MRYLDLADLLIAMGAKIEGAGTSTIRVQGVDHLGGAEHTIIPDRIEAGTFLVAGAITDGDVTVTHCIPDHVGALVSKLQQSGVEVTQPDATTLRVRGRGRLRNSLYAAALPAAFQWNPALVSLYSRLIAKGKSHKVALVACARKLIVFANTVLQRQSPWTPQASPSKGCSA